MINVGDRVKINIEALERNGMSETATQVAAHEYILDNPDEVYVVKVVDSPVTLAKFSLDHPVLGITSFFRDELIKVGDNE